MAWIESHDTLGSHPKTRKLSRLLGINRVQAVGHLQFFWWWAMSYAPDGDLGKFDALDIATGAEWEGDEDQFLSALIASGFVDEPLAIHDWDNYGGKLVRRKNANAERMKATRAEHVLNTQRDGAKHVAKSAEPEKRREEKRREKETRSSSEHAPEQKATKARPTRMVPDWEPTPLAHDKFPFSEMELGRQLDLFRDHFLSNGEAKADWNAAWRNWLRRAPSFDRKPASTNGRHDKFAASGQKLLTSADLRRMATGDRDEQQRDHGVIVDSQFRVAESTDHGGHRNGLDVGV